MIKSIADTATRQFIEAGKSRYSGLDPGKAMARLNVLNAARSLDDISPLRSIGLHKLSGDRKGQWAMTINGPWRLCFRFENGDAYDVEIVDYH
ncbi:type II toxin-antitoxin system RelE/ParE family toxin [Shinella zoogloeoides]|uniref:Plasmid maintenance system killer protein n=1 Tax=Shinella zoogloeoides TaxID=352475 RepID=A0A6N8TDU9_SHIZO|nr:type II toxin-antitoxin system RelE/ParE family toxin [Shinella zoogloeoides]MXN99383.1 plasmid maintenance system killer protein [Shinella zoogloeoides]UEX82838.1 type II toxin-antitoxin system RelE/ParE family toxin [Shinella zoogloeoides]